MTDEVQDIFNRLAEPYPVSEVKWRIGSRNRDKTKIKPLCYVDARCVMDRLDTVLGQWGWEDRYQYMANGTVVCYLTIKIKIDDEEFSTTKSDGAGQTDIEAEKGQLSDAFKRASVKFGMGRYLYTVDGGWVTQPANQSWIADDAVARLAAKLPNNITKGKNSKDLFSDLTTEYRQLLEKPVLIKWGTINKERIEGLPESWQKTLRQEFGEHMAAID